jgi:integrase
MEARTNRQGKPITETTNKVRNLMSQLWRYASATGKAKHDIAYDLKGALRNHTGRNYSHITEPTVLARLIRGIRTYPGSPAVKAAINMLPLVFVRPGELRTAKWQDIDLEKAEWRYTVTKTDIPHVVPLSRQVVQILKDLHPLTGQGIYVFKGTGGSDRPISDNTMNQAYKSLGYTSDIIQPHGFRHTAATMLAEMGYGESEIERQLSHLVPGVKGRYQKAKYLPERIKMMQEWADYLDRISA